MKMVTETVQVTRPQFEDNDIVLDRGWFSVGIRRVDGGEGIWFITPHTTAEQNRVLRTYTDTEMYKAIEDGFFAYIGKYYDLFDNAPKVG